MIPNGSSGGLAYAAPSSDIINDGLRALETHFRTANPSPKFQRHYGSVTNQIGSTFEHSNGKGDINFGSFTDQRNDDFTRASSADSSFGSVTNQLYNRILLSNVDGKVTLGSQTVQQNSRF